MEVQIFSIKIKKMPTFCKFVKITFTIKILRIEKRTKYNQNATITKQVDLFKFKAKTAISVYKKCSNEFTAKFEIKFVKSLFICASISYRWVNRYS